MRKTINTVHTINAPAERVWAQISKASGVHEWLPVITACRLEGTGEGARRVCTTEQGGMNETILKVDHEHRVFRYAIDEQPLLPVEDVVGTMRVREQDGQTELQWTLDFFLPDEAQFPTVQQAVARMYAAGAQGLETLAAVQ